MPAGQVEAQGQDQGDEEADRPEDEAQRPEDLQGPVDEADDELDRHQVEEDAPRPGQAVLGFAPQADDVGDGLFDDLEALPADEGRDEAVQLAVEADALDDFAAVGLEGRAEVVDRDLDQLLHHPVGHPGGELAQDGVVLAVLAPAADDVVALVQLGQELGNLGRVVLEVAVHGNDDLAPGLVETRLQGRRLAEVAAELDQDDVVILFIDLLEGGVGSVRAAVVDEDQLVGPAGLVQNVLEAGVHLLDIVHFVVKGDDDAQLQGRGVVDLHGSPR